MMKFSNWGQNVPWRPGSPRSPGLPETPIPWGPLGPGNPGGPAGPTRMIEISIPLMAFETLQFENPM